MSSEIENKYVIFKLEKEYYGISIANVLSIEKPGQATRIPNAPNYVKGVMNLRGDVVPIISLGTKLGIESECSSKNTRIIVVQLNDIVVGIVVDSSSEVLEIEKENIDKPPTNENNRYIEYISGIGKTPDRLIILLDLSKVLEY